MDFDSSSYSLAEHGDSRQRACASQMARLWPSYELFWRSHLVPLTFRPYQAGNYFIRPTQTRVLLRLADSSYAAFFHFAGCLDWRDDLPRGNTQGKRRSSECLYCFFSHAGSLLDAVVEFCDAVNAVLRHYRADEAFHVFRDADSGFKRLGPDRASLEQREFRTLSERLKPYRNFLVHSRPVLVQNDYMPRVQSIREMTGLTVISQVARKGALLDEHFEPIEPTLDDLLQAMGAVLDLVWARGERALQEIDNPKYRQDQLYLRPDDEGLTLDKILAARGSKER